MSLTTLLLIKTLPPHGIAITVRCASGLLKQEANRNTLLLITHHVILVQKKKGKILTEQEKSGYN